MKKVLVFGTFEQLHPGHIYFLEESQKYGEKLIVVIARDEYVLSEKGVVPLSLEERMEALSCLPYVDSVVVADEVRGSYGVIHKNRPDIICFGYDQKKLFENFQQWNRDNYSDIEVKIIDSYKPGKYSSTKIRRKEKSIFLSVMFVAMILWGISWVSGKEASSYGFSPLLLSFLRFFFSFLSLLPFCIARKELKWEISPHFLKILTASLMLLLYNVFFFSGLETSFAGRGGMLVTSLIPLITFFLSYLFQKKKIKIKQILALLLGFFGCLVLSGIYRTSIMEFVRMGNSLLLFAALCWAVLTLISATFKEELSVFSYSFYLYGFVALMIFPFIIGELSQISQIPLIVWINIFYLSLFAGTAATGAYFIATRKLGAEKTSGFTFLVPLFALLSASLILGEPLSIELIFGGATAVTAVWLLNH